MRQKRDVSVSLGGDVTPAAQQDPSGREPRAAAACARSCTSPAAGSSPFPRADRLVDARPDGGRICETGDGGWYRLRSQRGLPLAFRTVSTATWRRLAVGQGTPVDASITVEVSAGASDRFGCKISAMINGRLIAEIVALFGERAGYDALGAARVHPPGPAPRDAAKHACTPAAGHCLSAGAKSLWKSEQWVAL